MVYPLNLGAEAAIDRAIGLRTAGFFDESIALLEQALGKEPNNPRLWQTLGTVHRANCNSTAAFQCFEAAGRITPHDVLPAHGVAQAALEAGRPAVPRFQHALRLAPSDGGLIQGLAAARLAEGDHRGAIEELATIVDSNPLWLDGHRTLAALRWSFGEEKYDRSFRSAVRQMPQAVAIWRAWIDLLIGKRDFEQAEETAARALAVTGPDSFIASAQAIIAAELGQTAIADARFGALPVDRDPALAERFVRHLLRTGRQDDVEAIATPFLGQPDDDRFWPYLALVWRLREDPRWEWLEGRPEFVAEIELPIATERLAQILRALHVTRAEPLGQSVRQGTQTDGPLLSREEPEICELRSELQTAIRRYIAGLPPSDEAHPLLRHVGRRFRFAGSWSVRFMGKGHHSAHVHPQGWISSAFYVVVPQNVQSAPDEGALELGTPPRELGLPLKAVARVTPSPAKLVLFPSTMWHSTRPFREGERMSVAFDVAACR